MKHIPQLTDVQIGILKALCPANKMYLRLARASVTWDGYIADKKVCREKTWLALLKKDYIKNIAKGIFVITEKGKSCLFAATGESLDC